MESLPDTCTFVVEAAESNTRIDRYLVERLPEISRAQMQRIIENGQATLNGKTVKVAMKVQTGDILVVEIELETVPSETAAQDIPLDIVYEDSDLLVINKAKGMVVHPAPGAPDGTLVNALLYHCRDLSGIGGVERPGIVHRLDKDTSGLMMVAKNDRAHVGLQQQLKLRTASRRYIAYVWGSPKFEKAVIDAPIERHPVDRKRMVIASKGEGRDSVTYVTVTHRFDSLVSRIECKLETGRTHQIRAHCEFAGHPVLGDSVYSGLRKTGVRPLDEAVAALHGQSLHAGALSFQQPRTGESLSFVAPPPAEMQDLDTLLRKIADSRSR